MGHTQINQSGVHSMTDAIIEKMKTLDRFQLAITPKEQRKFNPAENEGFIITKEANVPLLSSIDMDYQEGGLWPRI